MKRSTDDVRIELCLDFQPAPAPVNFTEVFLTRPTSIGACGVDLELSAYSITQSIPCDIAAYLSMPMGLEHVQDGFDVLEIVNSGAC